MDTMQIESTTSSGGGVPMGDQCSICKREASFCSF